VTIWDKSRIAGTHFGLKKRRQKLLYYWYLFILSDCHVPDV